MTFSFAFPFFLIFGEILLLFQFFFPVIFVSLCDTIFYVVILTGTNQHWLRQSELTFTLTVKKCISILSTHNTRTLGLPKESFTHTMTRPFFVTVFAAVKRNSPFMRR